MRSLLLVAVSLMVLGCRRQATPRAGDFAEFNWHTTTRTAINPVCSAEECIVEGWTKTEFDSLVRFQIVAVDETTLSEVITVLPGKGTPHPLHDVVRDGLQVRLSTAGTVAPDVPGTWRDPTRGTVKIGDEDVRCDFNEGGCVVINRATPTQGLVEWTDTDNQLLLVREGHDDTVPPLTGTPLFSPEKWVELEEVSHAQHARGRETWSSRAGFLIRTWSVDGRTSERGSRLLPTVGRLLQDSFFSVHMLGVPVKWRDFDAIAAPSDGKTQRIRMAPHQKLPTGMPLPTFVGMVSEVVDWSGAPPLPAD